jgi:hypothetical protein
MPAAGHAAAGSRHPGRAEDRRTCPPDRPHLAIGGCWCGASHTFDTAVTLNEPIRRRRAGAAPITIVTLGEGVLTWPRAEQISGRYGLVALMAKGGISQAKQVTYLPLDQTAAGRHGRLHAEVLETHRSPRVGDVAGGSGPSTPKVEETIRLGTGTLVFAHDQSEGGYDLVGLAPDDGRRDDWFDPEALYRCREQTVRLTFVLLGC